MNSLTRLFQALLAPIIVFGVNLIWMILDLYRLNPHTDSVFHVAGGISIAIMVDRLLVLFFTKKHFPELIIRQLLIFTGTVTVAVLWEFAEFLIGEWFQFYLQRGVADTMKDLALGMCGALFYLIVKVVVQSRS